MTWIGTAQDFFIFVERTDVAMNCMLQYDQAPREALLAAISEKDANIALLELSASKKKKTQEEVMALKREKDRLVHQLKQQVYRPRKQPPSSNIPCTCDAGYSPDITAKYHGSSYDAYMIQRYFTCSDEKSIFLFFELIKLQLQEIMYVTTIVAGGAELGPSAVRVLGLCS
ncbi:ERC protein 2 [Tupaia chinensis]|uniref:ERC protein 2 n=1 Tax=Tupaia chinensis TaxID=246437 RepID=L9L6P9_TUPCH|nr:ERC protein 2 [Tupaia chinensis]